MIAHHEKMREDEGRLVVYRNTDYIFPPHFHINLEIFIVRRGDYTVTVNGKSQRLTNGSVLFIDSYDIHSYDEVRSNGEDAVVIIPFKYLERYNFIKNSRKVATPVIASETLCDELMELVVRVFQKPVSKQVLTAGIEMFLALICDKLRFEEVLQDDESDLIRRILNYLSENYRKPISRASVAKHFGYTEAHISRAFHRYIKTSMPNYINMLRLESIERQRAAGDTRKSAELIYDAGFNSLQTYYRCKNKTER